MITSEQMEKYKDSLKLGKKGGILMAPKAVVNELLVTLDEQDYDTVVDFIQFLSTKRRVEKANQSNKTLKEIQAMFADDKGWDSEESMIVDMAAFRRERMGL